MLALSCLRLVLADTVAVVSVCVDALQSKFADAEMLQHAVIATRKKAFGDDDPDTLIATSALARIYSAQGTQGDKADEAARLQATVLAVRDCGLFPARFSHSYFCACPHRARILLQSTLNSDFVFYGCFPADLTILRSFFYLQAQRRVLGPVHTSTLVTADDLVDLFVEQVLQLRHRFWISFTCLSALCPPPHTHTTTHTLCDMPYAATMLTEC